ncbi:hypothetical protein FXB40_45725 [Bradyrhizobium rifense]|uniref:Uncharacterized protein n=1 Tax=Bradyrhizobium rifense TaxID=515499 RepID=A0A5D3JW41_9BRAD|nr:hypothetical protein [Bradyrhizobium rifense]TYL83903.1 hypothetical protein FXB40_45725 [Bradyrhizobium rifense]
MISLFEHAFFRRGFAMANGVEDLQILRLIRAFQKLTDKDARRMIVRYVEEQVERQMAKPNSPPGAA